MFLTVEDYRVVTSPADLDIICQSSDSIRLQAERTAMEEVAGYVRTRYDIDRAYAAAGSDRNPLLVQLTVSIAIYWMSQWLPIQREIYLNVYNAIIARLREIQKGDFALDLWPYVPDNPGDDNNDNPNSFGISWGSIPYNGKYDW